MKSRSLDYILEVLKVDHRRKVLTCLKNTQHQTMTTEDLVEQMDERGTAWTGKRALKMQLHHIHLPKLAETGLIEFDPKSGMLRYLGDEHVEMWLDRLEQREF